MMADRRRAAGLLALLTALAPAAWAQGSEPEAGAEPDTLAVAAGRPVAVTIAGRPVALTIAPDAVSVPTLNPDAAARLGLKPGMIGFGYRVGATSLMFRTDEAPFVPGPHRFSRRSAFGTALVAPGADGVAGPATFPFARTVIRLRAATAADQPIVLPLVREGRSLTGTAVTVGGQPLLVGFSLDRPTSLATATAGRWIADAHGGSFTGAVRSERVLSGAGRPVRPLALSRPLLLGPLEVRSLGVRVADEGSAQGIAEAAPTGGQAGSDAVEIVVTAAKGRKPKRQRLLAGTDTIGHCASITYDFERRTVTLHCPAQPPGRRPRRWSRPGARRQSGLVDALKGELGDAR